MVLSQLLFCLKKEMNPINRKTLLYVILFIILVLGSGCGTKVPTDQGRSELSTPILAPTITDTQIAARTSTALAEQVQPYTATMQAKQTALALKPSSTATPTPEPVDDFFDPQRFSYEHNFYVPEIQAFLEEYPGPLKDEYFQIGDRRHSFAEVLIRMSTLYSINPKILLALLECQSGMISTAEPTKEQYTQAMGFENMPGLYQQFRWGAIQVRLALRDYAVHAKTGDFPALVFKDGTQQTVPEDITMTRYVMKRFFAPLTTPADLSGNLVAFQQSYQWLFEDPRFPQKDLPAPSEPFLSLPMEHPIRVTSFFDHDTPFLQENGDLLSYWGIQDARLSYDGHPGWDYALIPPDPILAAADGTVVFAGNSNDGCSTMAQAVIIDHHNGYRSLYWHLSAIHVERGDTVKAGFPIGIVGASGCSVGPHLHFQVQYLGRDVDPYGWCGSEPDGWSQNPAGQESRWLWKDMPSPCAPPPPAAIMVDETSEGFTKIGEWEHTEPGYEGNALYSISTRGDFDYEPWQIRTFDTPSVAIWQPQLTEAGQYRILAYVPYVLNGLDDTEAAHYLIHSQQGQIEVVIDERNVANGWADLGIYEFDPDNHPLVSVSTLAGDHACGVWADAVMWIPIEQ